MTQAPFKLLRCSDIGSIFDSPFAHEDPRLPDLFWSELEDGHVVGSWIDLPDHDLPDFMLFSGRTPAHQHLCARVAAWLRTNGRGFSAENQGLGYPGGIADVVSADQKLFAECGYTSVGKILRGLHDGLEMVVASYSFDPVLFRRAGAMHFESYLKKLEEDARKTVELLPIALRYEDVSKARG